MHPSAEDVAAVLDLPVRQARVEELVASLYGGDRRTPRLTSGDRESCSMPRAARRPFPSGFSRGITTIAKHNDNDNIIVHPYQVVDTLSP